MLEDFVSFSRMAGEGGELARRMRVEEMVGYTKEYVPNSSKLFVSNLERLLLGFVPSLEILLHHVGGGFGC